MKNIKLISIILSASILTACSHENPLNSLPRDDVGKFLANASWSAEKAQNARTYQGRAYGMCLMHDKKVSLNCNKLYGQMQDYALNDFEFKDITISDLMDVKMFYKVREDYTAAFFTMDFSA